MKSWRRLISPVAEYVAQELWARRTTKRERLRLPTRLTQEHRREAKGGTSSPANPVPRPPTLCRVCGVPIERGKSYCALCGVSVSKQNLFELAKAGRVAAQSPEAQARRTETKRRQDARKGWLPSSQPDWLTSEFYLQRIQPKLAKITVPAIAAAIDVSLPYATDIRAGRRRPHPRHWQALTQLVGLSPVWSTAPANVT